MNDPRSYAQHTRVQSIIKQFIAFLRTSVFLQECPQIVFPKFRATRTTTHVAILTKRSIAKAEGPKATTNVTHRSFDFADCACLLLNFLVLLHHSEVCTF
jgi:hypothetical protein